jgi:hypothetical protein
MHVRANNSVHSLCLGYVYYDEMWQRERRRVGIQNRLDNPQPLSMEDFKEQRHNYEEHVKGGGRLNQGTKKDS